MLPENADRDEPHWKFEFQVVIAGKTVARLSKMGSLKRTTEAVRCRSAGDPSFQRNRARLP